MQPKPNIPRRVFLTWDDVDRLIDKLVPQFKREFNGMVIVTRGGLIPGGMLASVIDSTPSATS